MNARVFQLLNPLETDLAGNSAFESHTVSGVSGEGVELSGDGELVSRRFFLLMPQLEPQPGCKIGDNGEFFDIGDIKCCRDTEGNIAAYRCVVLS
ncbi:MAG: hypothetical protein RR060_06675 [Victivallaceae bacterium]